MAYLKGLPIARCNGEPGHTLACNQTATVELLDRRNATYGPYCQRCGNKALKRLQAHEADQDNHE